MEGFSLTVDLLGRLTAGALAFARRHRTIATSLVYALIATGALSLAYLADLGFDLAVVLNASFATTLALLITIRLVVNHVFRL